MARAASLKVVEPTRGPARAALADAIEAAAGATAAAAKQRDTVKQARDRVARAETRLAEAETALTGAKAALTGDGVPAALREARFAVADAADVRDAARVALAKAEAAAEEPEYEVRKAQERVSEAAGRVIFERLPALQERLAKIHGELTGLQAEMAFVTSHSVSGIGNIEASAALRRASAACGNARHYLGAICGVSFAELEVTDARWAAAREALFSDADAELPA